ncbi:MAG TPA: methylenetetrahydrofolate reductase [Woeseiaceae bacterium]|nr:methylenetetrahydrofolate reductase [Woeseiaceae bacterium]
MKQTFRDAMRGKDFVLTVQLPLDSGTVARDVHADVDRLREHVDAVQVSDNPGARPHISPIAAACLVLQAGVDPVVHLHCRDRNRIALQSELMGAAAIGVTSLVLSRGEKLPASLKQQVKGVFDIGAQRLLATAQALNAHERLIAPPGFFLGANVTAIDPPEDWTADGVDGKADAGIKFVQTQACLDLETLRSYMAALIARKALERISVVVQVPLIDSMEMLQELRHGRRPLLVPEAIVQRLKTAVDIRTEGETICRELLEGVQRVPGISGVNLICRNSEAATRVLGGCD